MFDGLAGETTHRVGAELLLRPKAQEQDPRCRELAMRVQQQRLTNGAGEALGGHGFAEHAGESEVDGL